MTDTEINEYVDSLIDATSDSEAAFHAAAGAVRGDEARALLLDRAWRHGRATAALRALADERRLKPTPGAEPTPRIAPPRDDAAILTEAERKEAAVIFAFCDALERPLPPSVHQVIEDELENLLAGLGAWRSARDRAARQRRLVLGSPV